MSCQHSANPLSIPEIIGLVVENVLTTPDLLNCACVNNAWYTPAMRRLYRGSLNDMQFRTPDIGSLNCLFVASRRRFAENMTHVQHFLLCSEVPSIDEAAHPGTRLACFEKFRAIRQREHTKLLLQPGRRGLISLAIPFEIKDQDWSHISDLVASPSLEFLSIDNSYCQLVLNIKLDSVDSAPLSVGFPSLKAVTIYKSDDARGYEEVCQLLGRSDLQFFHLATQRDSHGPTRPEITNILRSLQRQQSLRALALCVSDCGQPIDIPSISSTTEPKDSPWPLLKALYLDSWNTHWLERLSQFKFLEILRLGRFVHSAAPMRRWGIATEISKFQYLRSVEFTSFALRAEEVLRLASGCPLLEKLNIEQTIAAESPVKAENLFRKVVLALPRLEFLRLDLKFAMDGTKLQALADQCSRLTVLELSRAQLFLSLRQMVEMPPFRSMEIMQFRDIWFEKPQILMLPENIHNVAREWQRIFPKLREIPCPGDEYFLHRDGDDFGRKQVDNEASLSTNADHQENKSGLDFEDFTSDWFWFRIRLWKTLGYGVDQFIRDQVANMWQGNLEVETVGWPILAPEVFVDPAMHSTTSQCSW